MWRPSVSNRGRGILEVDGLLAYGIDVFEGSDCDEAFGKVECAVNSKNTWWIFTATKNASSHPFACCHKERHREACYWLHAQHAQIGPHSHMNSGKGGNPDNILLS